MAIIDRKGLVAVDTFLSRMRQAALSVMRVASSDPDDPASHQGLCTGWLIAPGLLLLPGYALGEGERKLRRVSVQVWSEASPVFESESAAPPELLGKKALAEISGIALLRMRDAADDRVLPLSFEPPTPGDTVLVIQYAGGNNVASIACGELRNVSGTMLTYSASTSPGSGGAPVLDLEGRVAGMHALAQFSSGVNQGVTRAALVEALHESRYWPEIAAHHKLADEAAARKVIHEESTPVPDRAHDPVLMRAALRTVIEPDTLSAKDRGVLSAFVADPKAPQWTLRSAERRRIIDEAGSVAVLRPFKPKKVSGDAAQIVINDILDGPPYGVDDATEDQLSWWIQASRWFEGVARDLPTPADIAQALERKRVRSRLDQIIGPTFVGRDEELGKIRKWFKKGASPLLLTGIGGIGKSSLVARFVSELPQRTLILWLDFDRADLAPDNAVSVLAALVEQLKVQLPDFEAPSVKADTWEKDANLLGRRLATAVTSKRPAVLVLDSFEAAQYTERYQELWPVLETLCNAVPALRVVVAGRAPVPGLELNGHPTTPIHLEGLGREAAAEWLRGKGLADEATLKAVLDLANGIPLILRLALRLLEAGGNVRDLPQNLKPAIVAGFLYDRILDRVQSRALKPLAMGALVLRRLTAEMIQPVLAGLVELPPAEPAQLFRELSREMALVEGDETLRLRPEVRAATLALLERDQEDLVRAIDGKAANWYAGQDTNNPEIAAELVYHRLRLGDIEGAQEAWRDGSGALLTYAPEEIRDPRARAWLATRLGTSTETGPAPKPLAAWEQDAADRIRSARARDLGRNVGNILEERAERSDSSPLIFHEAYELSFSGDLLTARHLLDGMGYPSGTVGRERLLLRAMLARDGGDYRKADECLARIEPNTRASAVRALLEALAVEAARMRLTIDVKREVNLFWKTHQPGAWGRLDERLSPIDVVLPSLEHSLLSHQPVLERSREPLLIPPNSDDAHAFLARIEHERATTLRSEPPELARRRAEAIADWTTQQEQWSEPAGSVTGAGDANFRAALKVAELGWRRWWLAAYRPFLASAFDLCLANRKQEPLLAMSILGTLAVFASPVGNLVLRGSDGTLLYAALDRNSLAQEALQASGPQWAAFAKGLEINPAALTPSGSPITPRAGDADVWRMFKLFAISPDPLAVIVNQAAGHPMKLPGHAWAAA